MSSRSSSSNSFSSFSDLKDLQAQLRRQNADLAQAKADAIIVKDGQESTNKLKQKAASLAKFTSAAENALKAKALEAQSANHSVLAASDNDNARGTNGHAQKQDRRDRLQRADRAERSNDGNRTERGERTNHHEQGERTNRSERGERTNHHEQGERTNRAERGSNRRERNDGSKNRNRSNDRNKNETEQQRLDRALNRLQRKAMDLNEHAQKDQERKVADKSERDSKDRKASNKKQAQQRPRSNHEERKDQNRPRQDHESKNKRERNAKSAKEKKGAKKAPLLDGKYFDLEALKLVREHQDNMSYQSRRLAYRKLTDLDQAILALMQSLFDDASTCAAPSAAAAVTHAPASTSAAQAAANASDTNSADTASANAAAAAGAGAAGAAAGASAAGGSAAVGVDKRELLKDVLASEEIVLKREELKEWVESEVASLKARGDNVPKLEYPEALPVSQRREEIVKAIKENQVVIIAGETGSGKTTQIPKMCLEAGFGIKGLIGHTQPRRLAARAVASRIAEELHEQLGKSVSYKVRFTDIGSPEAYIKLMTDGILLSELASDRQLLSYDVIIIDEAHERSLNIDFLLGYLKTLLIRRPELKLIITSATIDVERFSEHFGGAPIIEVSGRTYPVEVVYMPLMEDHKGVYIEHHDGTGHYERDYSDNGFETGSEERNAQIDAMLADNGPGAWSDYQHAGGAMAQLRMAANSLKSSNSIKTAAGANTSGAKSTALKSAATALRNVRNDGDEQDIPDTLDIRQGILQAVHYLMARGRGDILVFLPGERDILEISQFLRKAGLKDTEIVPLYARLAASEQNKIFTEHTGVRIVLSTNVAETSLTVPGIKYVIDPGLARISRYSSRTKVQRLPIERVSQASANQRKGRCGRVSDGICVRLYSKDDFDSRPQFTDPEILRTNLASVLLQMASLRLGRVESFPFIDAPQQRQVSDGLRLLDELGATVIGKGNFGPDGEHLQLTQVGRTLSRLPCDPRLGRMIIEASKVSCSL